MSNWRRVTAFLPNGMVTLDDGEEMQVVVARNGALGVRKATREDHVSSIDQVGGLADKDYFKVDIDQA